MKLVKRLCILLLAFLLIGSAALLGACSSGGGSDTGDDTQQGDNSDGDNTGGDGGNTDDDNTGGDDGGNTGNDNTGDEEEETPITLTLSVDEVELDVGESRTITATVTGTSREVHWYVSSGLYFDVEQDDTRCTVTGTSGGTATVTAYVSDVTASAEVTVIEMPITADYDLQADGDLSDWTAAGITKTISVTGQGSDDSHKSATIYGVLEKDGLYLAVEAYHDLYVNSYTDISQWWYNTQFEFFVGLTGHTQYFVYASEDSDTGYKLGMGSGNTDVFEATMVTTELNEEGPANYKTIVEVFVPINQLPAAQNATLRVGVAWKTPGDLLLGGEAGSAENEASEYWVPKGCYSSNTDKPYVTGDGIYLPDEYENA